MAGSLLESFLILFESDSSDVKSGAEEAEKSVDDLEESIDSSNQQASELGASLGDLAKTAATAFAALFAVNAIQSGIINTAASADELLKFSELVGENVGEIDAWGGAVVRAGGTADGFRSSLRSLNEKLVEVAVRGDGEVLPFFNQLGIAITDSNGKAKSTLELLPQLADSFQNLSKSESAGLGSKLGLDDSTIRLLQSGRENIDKLIDRQKVLGVTSVELAEESAKFVDIMADFDQVMSSVGRLIATAIIPAFTGVLDGVTDIVIFLKKNETFAIAFFGGIAAVIGAVYLPAILSAAAATLVAAAPFIAMAALVGTVAAAFGFLVDDIQNFREGNNSVIGELSKDWPIVGQVVNSVLDGIGAGVDLLGVVFSKLGEYIKSPMKILEDFQSLVDFVFKGASKVTDLFFEGITAHIDFLGLAFTKLAEYIASPLKLLEDLRGIATDVFDGASDFFGAGDNTQTNNLNMANEHLAGASSVPINNMTNNQISNQANSSTGDKSVAFTGDINVQASGNTQADAAAAQKTGEIFKAEIRRAVDNFDNGLVA